MQNPVSPITTHTHQNVLIELADHKDDPLGLGQLGVVEHAQALGGILPVGLHNRFRAGQIDVFHANLEVDKCGKVT